MVELVWLIPALPLFGFLVLLVAGRKLGEPLAGWFATLMCSGAFVAAVIVVEYEFRRRALAINGMAESAAVMSRR